MKTIVREKRWNILPADYNLQNKLSTELNIFPAIAQILINRKTTSLTDANSFLKKDISSLYDPFMFQDMEKITKRIISAIKNKEKITIYGDYDADGICATALLLLSLQELGADCNYYLPNRIDEGYGLNRDAVAKCKDFGTQLLITVDCGISAKNEIEYAKNLGMDVIVTDHHEPPRDIPVCAGILNPKVSESKYPFKDLAGVGVAFKLISAIAKKTGRINPKEHLDLVAIGTVADIVPLTGENRTLVHHGLLALLHTNKIGLIKLKEKAGVGKDIQAGHIAFRLAPRINAAGRLSTAETAIKLLLTKNESEAEEYSTTLNKNNIERQKIEQDVLDDAIIQIESKFNFNNQKIVVLEGTNWPSGVIGIVAGRIANQYHRPCIIISAENGLGKGSGRSIKKFHLLEALTSCSDHLIKFGGHAHAAGLSIEETLIRSFREKINEYAENTLSTEDLVPSIDIDAEIKLKDISFDLISQLDMLEPLGYDNPKPCFVSKNMQLYGDPQIVGEDHLKFRVKSEGRVFEAIGFGMADYISYFDESANLDLAYRPQINTWMNKKTIQLQVVDIKTEPYA
jgi:single-stranded-DNA-specific exonuclease